MGAGARVRARALHYSHTGNGERRNGRLIVPADDDVRQLIAPLARKHFIPNPDFAYGGFARRGIDQAGQPLAQVFAYGLIFCAGRDSALRLAPFQIDADASFEVRGQGERARVRPIHLRFEMRTESVAQLPRQAVGNQTSHARRHKSFDQPQERTRLRTTFARLGTAAVEIFQFFEHGRQ